MTEHQTDPINQKPIRPTGMEVHGGTIRKMMTKISISISGRFSFLDRRPMMDYGGSYRGRVGRRKGKA